MAHLSIHRLLQLLFMPLLQSLHTFFSLSRDLHFQTSSPFFQSFGFPFSSSVFFTPLTSLFPSAFIVPWLLLPYKKGGSALPVFLRVKALLGLHRARCRRSWSTQLSLYRTPGTPQPVFSSGVSQWGPSFPSHLGVLQPVGVRQFCPGSRSKGDFRSPDYKGISRGGSYFLWLCSMEDHRLAYLGG